MAHCLWCDGEIIDSVSWHEVFGISKKQSLCRTCRNRLEVLAGPLCRICGRPLDQLDASFRSDDLCHDCIRWENSEWSGVLVKNRSLYGYNAFLKEIIARFKFRGDAIMVKGFQAEWGELYKSEFSGKDIVPVPLSSVRLYERGFNQALELASLLPATLYEALERTVHEQKQSKKSRAERIHHDDSPIFRCNGLLEEVKGLDIVIVDDIYTTGATVRRAAKVLLEGGAVSVSSITVARG